MEASKKTPKILGARDLINHYQMTPHVEGGYFVEVFRSEGLIAASALPDAFDGARRWSTAIMYLLEYGQHSRLHRLNQEEVWHFYLGGPLRLVTISPEGFFRETTMGLDVGAGQELVMAIPAGYWFAATPAEEGSYSLVGCTVAPGFEYADCEMGRADSLKAMFPHLAEVIDRFAG